MTVCNGKFYLPFDRNSAYLERRLRELGEQQLAAAVKSGRLREHFQGFNKMSMQRPAIDNQSNLVAAFSLERLLPLLHLTSKHLFSARLSGYVHLNSNCAKSIEILVDLYQYNIS